MKSITIKREEATDYISEMIADDFFSENPYIANLIITPSKQEKEKIISNIYKEIVQRIPEMFKGILKDIFCYNRSAIKFRNDKYSRYIYANNGSLTSICGIGGVHNLIFYDILRQKDFLDIYASAMPTIASGGKIYIVDDADCIDELIEKHKMGDTINFIKII